MTKATRTYKYVQPDGVQIIFKSTREVKFAALVFEENSWGRLKVSKSPINPMSMGQTASQSRYLATVKSAIVEVSEV